MNRITTLFSASAISLLSICCGCVNNERHDETSSPVADSHIEGRRAARKLINLEWKDSATLRQSYRDIILLRDSIIPPSGKAEFDSTLISTLRVIRPDLADAIDRRRL